MSVRIMTLVWDSGCYEGATLLVLLALADWANDNGKRVFPHLDQIAKKARISERSVSTALRCLEEDGVLVQVGDGNLGRGYRLEYNIDLERVKSLHPSLEKGCNHRPERVKPTTEKGEMNDAHIDNHQVYYQDNHQDSRREERRSPADLAFEEYNNITASTGWPKAETLIAARRKGLNAALKQCGGVEAFKLLLYRACQSDFLRGRTPKAEGHERWRVSLDFFINPTTIARLMEGHYDNRNASRPVTQTGERIYSEAEIKKHRDEWLLAYGGDGRWAKNLSEDSGWKDRIGVGPPPHDPRTMVTDDDLKRFPAARTMREQKLRRAA